MLSAMGLPRGETHRCKDGAPPSTIFKVIASQSRSAVDVSAMADSVAKASWHARLERSSSAAYASHLRMIAWGCRVFNIDPVDPGVQGVRRIAACVNNASTLSCWLSAWKCALEGLGASWPGDLDPLLKGIRRGTAKLQTHRMPRQRVRRALLRDLLKVALSKSSTVWYWWAFIGIVAHSFALRMPSELFAQFEFRKLKRSSNQWVYGPIRRKFRVDWQFPCAFCHCEVDPFMCLCAWTPAWHEMDHSKWLGGLRSQQWTTMLRSLLTELGHANAEHFYGHDVRRGAAVDVCTERGVDAMLKHGSWRSLGGAAAYVPTDEFQAGLFAQGVVDDSEPES